MFDDNLMFDDDLDTTEQDAFHDEEADDDIEIEDVFSGNDADDAWEWATDDALTFL